MSGIIGKKLGMTSLFDSKGKSVGCTVIEAGPCFVTQIKDRDKDGYRAIHLQLITKDGLSVELQVRLKSTKDILTRSHQLRALGKQKSENFKTAKGLAAFEQAQEMVKKELDDAWFRALEKQGAKSDELIDQDIHIGTRIDADGTEVDIVKPLREFLEEDVKAAQALERLKDCK